MRLSTSTKLSGIKTFSYFYFFFKRRHLSLTYTKLDMPVQRVFCLVFLLPAHMHNNTDPVKEDDLGADGWNEVYSPGCI